MPSSQENRKSELNCGEHPLRALLLGDSILHDIKGDCGTGVRNTPPRRYRDNLRAICARLRRTGATLIWASTTPVSPPLLGHKRCLSSL